MKKILSIAVCAVFWLSILSGQEGRGTINGRVEDGKSRLSLAGANILVRDTFLGATTDTAGRFVIKNIPPGTYTLAVSMIGYARKMISNVVVNASKPASLVVELNPQAVETQQVVVTASRREQALREVPVSVSTVTASALSLRVPVTLDDALRYVPGVNMMYDQINIRGSSGYSRGVGTRVLLLFDGVPYLTGDTGEITWETIPMFQVDHIEVVKGAGSALYGSSALGGVVNVITRDIPDKPQVAFRLYSGLYGNPGYTAWNWSPKSRFNSGGFVSFSDAIGSVRYLVSISRSVDDSYRESDVYHRWGFYVKSIYDLSSTQNLTLVGNLAQRVHENFFWWKSLRQATIPADDQLNDEVRSNRGNVSLNYNEFVSDKLFYSVKAIYYGNFWRDDSLGRTNNLSASHSVYSEAQVTFASTSANIITAGITGNYDKVTSDLFGTHPGVGAAAFAQDELTLDPSLKLTAGVRYDWQKVSVLRSGSKLNPKLGLVYALDDATSLRGSIGLGFRYPSISELYTQVNTGISILNIVPNPDLRSESSRSYEIGIGHSFSGALSLDWAIFQNDFSDLIEPSVDTTEHPTVIRFLNVTRARIRGTEANLKFNIVPNIFRGQFAYTYIDSKDLSTGAVLKFRPRNTLYGNLQLTAEHFTLEGDYRYLSRIEAIDENLVRYGPILDGDQRVPIKVVDVRVFYDLAELQIPIRVGLGITNLFNYHYVELIGNLAPIRTYMLTIDGMF